MKVDIKCLQQLALLLNGLCSPAGIKTRHEFSLLDKDARKEFIRDGGVIFDEAHDSDAGGE